MNESPFEQFEDDLDPIDDKELFFKIWTKPKQTLKYIVKTHPEKHVIILLILSGIVNAIDKAASKSMGDSYELIEVLAITLVVGSLFGWIGYYIYAWILSVIGSWLNGKSEPVEFRTILAWSSIPTICTLALLIPELAIFGNDLFKSSLSNDSEIYTMTLLAFGLLEVGLSIWSLVILVIGIKVIQNFSTGKAILNLVLPVIVIILPFLLMFLAVR